MVWTGEVLLPRRLGCVMSRLPKRAGVNVSKRSQWLSTALIMTDYLNKHCCFGYIKTLATLIQRAMHVNAGSPHSVSSGSGSSVRAMKTSDT
jgi:hypothetical protein